LSFEWESTAAIESRYRERGAEFDLLSGARDVYEMEGVRSVVASDHLLMGAFKDANGNRAYMLTNATNPWEERYLTATVQFDRDYKAVQIFEKGVPRIVPLKNGRAEIFLEAAEGKFLVPLKTK